MNRATWPGGEILRDITRGGLAGLVVGILVAGIGGRLVMRLAALLVPSATGALTENGNRIGEITLAGSVALIVFAGLAATILLAVVWVAIAPWLPGRGVVRGLVAMPIAVALAAFGLINASNPDFVVLRHDPAVVAILLALVALTAPAMAVADGWFDRRLPHAVAIGSRAGIVYTVLAAIGVALGSLLVLQSIGGGESQPLGLTVLAGRRAHARAGGRSASPGVTRRRAASSWHGRTILAVGTAVGYVALMPELAGALGIG